MKIQALDNWWRHNGIFDRQQASGIEYDNVTLGEYLRRTDEWWCNLTPTEKETVFEEFFSET